VKIKKQNIYITMLYTMVTAYMLGPMLSYKLGIPRIDNPLTLLLVPATLLIFFIENKTFNSKAGLMLMAVGLIAILNLATGHFIESKARQAVVALFGQYVSPKLVQRMAREPAAYPMESQNKRLTILFADIRGFTRIPGLNGLAN